MSSRSLGKLKTPTTLLQDIPQFQHNLESNPILTKNIYIIENVLVFLN